MPGLPQDTFGGSVRLSEEATWGVPVAVTNSLEIVSCSLARQIDRQPEGTLGQSGDRGRLNRRKFVASDNSSGDLVIETNYNDSFAMLLKHAMGVVGTVEAPPTVFTHSYTLGDLPIGLTLEKQWNATQAEIFTGCKVGSMTFAVNAGELAQGTFSLLAKTSGGVVAATTPTYNAPPDTIKYSDAGTLSFNGATYECIGTVTLSLDNGIDVRPVLGTPFTKEPVPASKREITLAIEIDWVATNALYADYLSGADSDVVITFTGALPPDALTMTLHNAHISEHPGHPLSGPEVVKDSVTFMAKSDGTNLGLKIDLVNANPLPTTN